jgi:hypothetical protein
MAKARQNAGSPMNTAHQVPDYAAQLVGWQAIARLQWTIIGVLGTVIVGGAGLWIGSTVGRINRAEEQVGKIDSQLVGLEATVTNTDCAVKRLETKFDQFIMYGRSASVPTQPPYETGAGAPLPMPMQPQATNTIR